jgi:hypothetical protein
MSSPNPLQQLPEAEFFDLVAQEIKKLSEVYVFYSKIMGRFEICYKDDFKVHLKKYELPFDIQPYTWWNAKTVAKEILKAARAKRKEQNEKEQE